MATILFPTSDARMTALGQPEPAVPCKCDRPVLVDPDSCLCGHWLEGTIRATWAEQARRMARVAGGPVRVRQNGAERRSEDYPDLKRLTYLRLVA